MIAVVAGGRDLELTEAGKEALHHVFIDNNIVLVYTGAASGIDRSAKLFAQSLNITTKDFPAQWKLYGKSAGPKRNEQMVIEASKDLNAVWIGFSGGRGTAGCRELADYHGLDIIDLLEDEYVTTRNN